MSAHDHATRVPGCFRCDLSREEVGYVTDSAETVRATQEDDDRG